MRLAAALIAAFLLAAPHASGRSADVAALQVALRATGDYAGWVDGLRGPLTAAAVRRFQARRGLVADGIAGPVTRRALGRRGRPPIGSRVLREGMRGWDVAGLQFLLGRHGFPSGAVDGGLGPRTGAALRRFQAWAGLGVDGLAGPATLARLRRRPPVSPLIFVPPLPIAPTDRFGPRGDRFHTGIDYPAAAGTRVAAAGRGCVTFAGYDAGGYGNVVVVGHRLGMTSYYAHLSSIAVRRGTCVVAGTPVGRVGSTGNSTGPHLHFELRLRGAAVAQASGDGRAYADPVELRAYTDADLALTEALETDPDVMRHLGGPIARERLQAVHRRRLADPWWLVIAEEPGGPGIGTIGVWETEHDGDALHETGWMVLPAHQGRGIASAALRRLIARVTAVPAITRIHAFPPVGNAPSNALCRKHGFTLLGEIDGVYAGRPLHCNHWALDVTG